jgi:hypothetical protein
MPSLVSRRLSSPLPNPIQHSFLEILEGKVAFRLYRKTSNTHNNKLILDGTFHLLVSLVRLLGTIFDEIIRRRHITFLLFGTIFDEIIGRRQITFLSNIPQ